MTRDLRHEPRSASGWRSSGSIIAHVARLVLVGLSLHLSGCKCEDEKKPKADKSSPQTDASEGIEAPPVARSEVGLPLSGGALFRKKNHLYIADEDESTLRIVELVGNKPRVTNHELPGRPAQVVAWDETVAVTVREPSLLILFTETPSGLVEQKRVALPDDAWGVAITGDRKRAWVTSPWVSRVSNVDLESGKRVFDFKVKREPRGVALTGDGKTAYVSHLVGSHVTVLVDTGGEKDPVKETIVPFPAAPLRSPPNVKLSASLSYAPVLSPDGNKLFVPRHALGALGKNSWFGAMSIDVLALGESGKYEPLAPPRPVGIFGATSTLAQTLTSGQDASHLGQSLTPVTQPRAAVYRKKANSLLVIGEGDDRLAEFDAQAVDPTLAVRRVVELGRERHEHFSTASICGAPTGLALSEEEDTAYVFCRATNDLVAVDLRSNPGEKSPEFVFRVAFRDDGGTNPPERDLALGRSIFFNSTDRVVSGGLACAGCHPEGRDDGYVWHEATFLTADGTRTNFVGHQANIPTTAHTKGVPRRTPMLAGRLKAEGPFGWHGESKTLPEREIAGFGLHRWGGMIDSAEVTTRSRALFVSIYLRKGLVAPRALREDSLSAQQKRGEEIFLSKQAECATCHVPETNYTNQEPFPLPPLPLRPGFDDEENQAFKTPSLRGLVGRAPYFHDGSAPSLFNLIETNHDRMGKTSHLSRADRDALIAFLETL